MRRSSTLDVPELMQNIQSWLPLKEAVRTSLLSKAWLHAWSTIPTLRFVVLSKEKAESMELVDVERTLIRYLHGNFSIEDFDLLIEIDNQDTASRVEKWMGHVATNPCLKEFSVSVFFLLRGASLTLPEEILSGENLTKIRVSSRVRIHSVLWMTAPVIKCVSLQELNLDGVRISEEALHGILSSCRLLVKIKLLHSCKGFRAIKIKNLQCLYKLIISGMGDGGSSTALEIGDVPNLGVFRCDLRFPFKSHSVSLGSSVTELKLGRGTIFDKMCLNMIESRFPFLESLTIDDMSSWELRSFHFTCTSIKILTLHSCPTKLVDIQVHAPKLLLFSFSGCTLPNFLFPVSTLEQFMVSLTPMLPVDAHFFLKMREALALSRKCHMRITTFNYKPPPLDMDIDDLRTRLLSSPPATNVQELSFETCDDECLWERSPFLDAFFEICHPKHVFAQPDLQFRHKNHFCRLMLKEVLEKKTKKMASYWPHYLEHVQIREAADQIWEPLTNSHTSFLDGSTPGVYMHFKLMWRC